QEDELARLGGEEADLVQGLVVAGLEVAQHLGADEAGVLAGADEAAVEVGAAAAEEAELGRRDRRREEGEVVPAAAGEARAAGRPGRQAARERPGAGPAEGQRPAA